MNLRNNIQFEYNCPAGREFFIPRGDHNFCTKCQEPVFDLTNMSRSEISSLMKAHEGKICGSFYSYQLEDTNNSYKKGWAAAGLFALLGAISPQVSAQEQPATVQAPQPGNEQRTDSAAVEQLASDEGPAYYKDEPPAEKKRRKTVRIGRRFFYADKRFPFIHSYYFFMGRLKF